MKNVRNQKMNDIDIWCDAIKYELRKSNKFSDNFDLGFSNGYKIGMRQFISILISLWKLQKTDEDKMDMIRDMIESSKEFNFE